MKSIKSMPAIASRGGLPGSRSMLLPAAPGGGRTGMPRSQSMGVNKPQERMRVMAKKVPYMAFTGVGSQLGTFARSFSRANLQRLGSRVTSFANLSKLGRNPSYGSMHDGLSAAPSPLDGHNREYSEGPLFGNTFDFDDDLEAMQPGFTLSLGLAVFTAVLASFQVGYNSGVLNVPQDTISAALHMSTLEWSFAVAIFCIGGLLGSMSGARLADRLGRKNFLIANNVLFIVGGLLESLSSSVVMLSLGRLLIGVGCGGATVVVPMYLGEIAPANLRGSLGTMSQFATVIGILVANLLGKPMGSSGGHQGWRYLLGLCIIPSLLQIIMSATLLESPLWLLTLGRGSGQKNRAQAEEVLQALRGTDEVEFDIECMLASVEGDGDDEQEEEEEERDYGAAAAVADGGSWGDDEYASRHSSREDIFTNGGGSRGRSGSGDSGGPRFEKGSIASLNASKRAGSLWAPQHRRPLLIGFGLQLVQQFSGINAVFFYSTAFFTSAHMSDPWLGSVLASSVNVLATGLSIYLIERMGRRKLLLISTMGMMLSCVGLTYALMALAPPSADAAPAASVSSSSSAMNSSMGGAPAAQPPAWVGFMSVGMILVFVSFFEIGLGPIPWLIGAEIFPNRIRSQAMGISSTINWLSNFAVGLSFPSISLALGPLAFAPFGVVLAVAFVLQYMFVPETQGKSLEEIQEEFLAQAGLLEGEGGDEEEGRSSIGDATPSRISGAGFSDEEDGDEDDEAGDVLSHSGSFQRRAGGGPHSSPSGIVGSDTPATPIPEGEEHQSGGSGRDAADLEAGSDEYDDDETTRY